MANEAPLQLSSELFASFPPRIRERGRTYFLTDRVHLFGERGSSATALVVGGEQYSVWIALTQSEIRVHCDCQAFSNMGVCKHIWATVLTCEQKNWIHREGNGEGQPENEDIPISSFPRKGRLKLRPPNWVDQISRVALQMQESPYANWPRDKQIHYIIDPLATIAQGKLSLHIETRRTGGKTARSKGERIPRSQIPYLPDPMDRDILGYLAGASDPYSYSHYGGESVGENLRLGDGTARTIVPRIVMTGRAEIRKDGSAPVPLTWDDKGTWKLGLRVEENENYTITGFLVRGSDRVDLKIPRLLLLDGIVFFEDTAALFDHGNAFAWVTLLRREDSLNIPRGDAGEMMGRLLALPSLPILELPKRLEYKEITIPPQPLLKLGNPTPGHSTRAELLFRYDDVMVEASDGKRGLFQAGGRRFILRDRTAEEVFAARLIQCGFYRDRDGYALHPARLLAAVRVLLSENWAIEAAGKPYRSGGVVSGHITSGIDWFDLKGTVEFGEASVQIELVLKALKRGERTVVLGDGSTGLLPEDWLKRYGWLGQLGDPVKGGLRFQRNQIGFLDALVNSQSDIHTDTAFRAVRKKLTGSATVKARNAPSGFVGKLRSYQKEGLGWLHFLEEFGIGGILADDMGLGKTVQVIAFLESRRSSRKKGTVLPSLVVVPKSLVFNWTMELDRFAPGISVLDYTGPERDLSPHNVRSRQIILTTYAILLRDIEELAEIHFDYVILDEAQAIKNEKSQSAKAARLLQSNRRLAMTGTPIENHLGELWSILEFLNPGITGQSSFRSASGKSSEEELELLARAVRPFILRRTKEKVARDLPSRQENILLCELEGTQRKLYDDLAAHYRAHLLKKLDPDRPSKSSFEVLEALLRLRQAACHPALIEPAQRDKEGAKITMLLSHLAEIIAEGHRALVFSQFTSFLDIMKRHLDQRKISYQYLDGKTKDRAARVHQFQNDATCPLFLISLKAGGLGLNLTGADYVFLMDPWWNPAVENQAIDRAHRIGQTRHVMAYRLIAKDTVEERIQTLQKEKRNLADAIIHADMSLMKKLRMEDIELLFSA